MKIQMTKNEKSTIDGFHTIIYSDPSKINQLNSIADNSCEYILSNTILDDFEISESPKIIATLVSKLRLNGSLIIMGHDIQMISKALLSDTISAGDVSDIIKEKRSISTALNTVRMLEDVGLKIVTVKLNDYLYEIVCTRE